MPVSRAIKKFEQAISEELDYDFEFNLPSGDSINSVAVTVSPAGLTFYDLTGTASTAKVWLKGGTVGVDYTVNVKITSTEGRKKFLRAIVQVRED